MNKLTIRAVRHGEVMLYPVKSMPKGKAETHNRFIVGHSETGHHHVLESQTEFKVLDGKAIEDAVFYLQLTAPARLVHQKTVNRHKDLTIPTGTYKVIHKTEYDPFQKIKRQVWD